ncbi:MAG: hypothetical protein COV52_00445 [Gammaproteobacteria bacterium CG11_big_fil_rev_8_21_14_0_20_46_22]|nr:MAG: hypothetical protein COW05_09070 [Gammaproteobacteria bacterium CG12_big_fil_rev_8_21_14_0_65_46_12]PIR12125.1 MAG: hypothetical protein COV52_00445 [Gammaproteobacteria bacterium CG11_big_fil_rev_8_21_14_0_20_46_22]
MFLVFLFLAVFTAFCQRAVYRFFYPNKIFFDTYAHIFRANHLREYRRALKQFRSDDPLLINQRFCKPASTNDPFLVLKLFSYFPIAWTRYLERYFNAAVDSFYVGLLFVCFSLVTKNLEVSFWGAVVYIFTPIFFTVQSTGPRTFGFTPRMLAECFGGSALIFLYFFLQYHFYTLYALSLLAAALAMMSNGFAGQAMFFIPLVLFCFVHVVWVAVFPILAFFLATIIGGKNFLRVFRFHVLYMGWYFVGNLKGRMAISDRNSLKKLLEAFRSCSMAKIYDQFFSKNSYLILLVKYPIYLLALILIFQSSFLVGSLFATFIFSGAIIFLLTSLKYFLSLGEAERYLHYLAFFVLIVVVSHPNGLLFAKLLCVYGILFQILDFLWLNYQGKRLKKTRNPEVVLDWIRKDTVRNQANILVIPHAALDGWRLLLETGANWVWPTYWMSCERREFERYAKNSAVVDIKKLDEVTKRYPIDLIIIEPWILKEQSIVKLSPPNGFNIVKGPNGLIVFQRALKHAENLSE